MNTPIIYVVDDDPAVRHALSTLLSVFDYAVEAYASGEDFLAANRKAFGCILLDVKMPGIDGLQVQEKLKRRGNTLPVVFLTAFGDAPRIVRAVKDGAEDFLIKPVEGEILLNRLQQILEKYASRQEQQQARQNLMEKLNALTEREREVMLLSMKGLTCKEIGIKLDLSYRTVELHRSHICTKTSMTNLDELFRLASSMGYSTI